MAPTPIYPWPHTSGRRASATRTSLSVHGDETRGQGSTSYFGVDNLLVSMQKTMENIGKSPFSMGKSTISMGQFQ